MCLFLSLHATFASAESCCTGVSPFFSVRSQSVNQPRMTTGWSDLINAFDANSFYATLAITPGYSKSFRHEDIARCLFGDSLQACECPTIGISGSQVENRGSRDWLADYFGLPTDYKSTITFRPRVETFFIDFALYVGLDEWVTGAWFKVWAPFVHTRWDLKFHEKCPEPQVNGYDAGYFTDAEISRDDLVTSARQFFQYKKTPNLGDSVSFESLEACRWGSCDCDTGISRNGIADIRFALGWNILQDENYHIGFGILAAGPTGSKPSGCALFEPIIGNGGHWELGGLLTSHTTVWRSENERKRITAHLDVNITHMYASKQRRCFDLCGKPMSRYMLAEKLGTPVNNLYGANATDPQNDAVAPIAQFKNEYAPVANLTCAPVNVSIAMQTDLVAMIGYENDRFSWDFGYNLWTRSCERIKFDNEYQPRLAQEADSWALKGDAHVYGFQNNASNAIALSATQSKATIFAGTNFVSANTTNDQNIRNFGVDNALFAQTGATSASNTIKPTPNNSTANATSQSKTSIQPELLSTCHINLSGARTKGLSHSLFTHFNYTWDSHNDYTPYLGIGAQAEFANNTTTDCKACCPDTARTATSPALNSCSPCQESQDDSGLCGSCCDSCKRCALSQWSVWLKGGISFD